MDADAQRNLEEIRLAYKSHADMQWVLALLAERDAEIARLRAALKSIDNEANSPLRNTLWRSQGQRVGTPPSADRACREIRQIARAALAGGEDRDGR
jgi:hypothetical protein